MKISECSSCGKLAIIENEMCSDCESKPASEQSQEFINQNQNEYTNSFAASDFSSTSFHPVQETEVFPQQYNNFSNQHSNSYYQQQRQFSNSNCRKCRISIPVSQIYCSRCSNKQFPVGKFIKGFAVIAILIMGFYFYRTFIRNSPTAIFEKYASVTGTDNFGDLESLSFSGKASISGTIAPHINLSDPALFDPKKADEPSKVKGRMEDKTLTYSMIFKKPNKSSIEIVKTDSKINQVIYKQVFDGINGWKLTNMPGQQSRLEDTGDGFSSDKMGLGIGDFDKVEFLNDALKAEYGEDNINLMKGLSTFYINEKWYVTESKEFVSVKTMRNGKNDSALMMFDKKTGFLLEIFKKDIINGSTVISKISTNSYKTFSIKEKPDGTAKSVLLPERWVIEMEELNTKGTSDSLYITIILNIDKVEAGIPVDESIFVKPIS